MCVQIGRAEEVATPGEIQLPESVLAEAKLFLEKEIEEISEQNEEQNKMTRVYQAANDRLLKEAVGASESTARVKRQNVIMPDNVPPAQFDSLALLVVDLTSDNQHDLMTERLDKVIASMNKQLSEDFYPVWGIFGILIHDKEVEEKLRARFSLLEGLGLVNTSDSSSEVFALSPFLENLTKTYDWDHTGVIYITNPDGEDPHHLSSPDPIIQKQIPAAVVFVMEPALETVARENKIDSWELSFSHEVLEMLADPVSAEYRAVHRPGTKQAWILEVCDPIEAFNYSYEIDGVIVSDFITPNFYDPAYRGGAVDFRGYLKQPTQYWNKGTWPILKTGQRDFSLGSGRMETRLPFSISMLAIIMTRSWSQQRGRSGG